MDKVNIADYQDVDYDKAIKDFRTARDKFQRVAEDPETPHAKKLLYEKLRKSMNYRIDLLNIENNKPTETPQGLEILSLTKKGIMGAIYRFWRTLKANAFTIGFCVLTSIFSMVATLVYTAVTGTAQTVIYVTKEAATKIGPSLPTIGGTIIAAGIKITNTLLLLSNHIVSIIIFGFSASLTLYQIYGEEAAFPILAVWAFVLAMGLAFLNYLTSFLKYLPF